MDDGTGLLLMHLIVRIGATIFCANRAGKLNRNQAGWGIFGFVIPIVAVIWILFLNENQE